jgi:hypothetical protein
MSDITFANKVYANLCNLVWYDYINDEVISQSWRGAGGFVADIRNIGEDYIDFYCSGNEGEVDKDFFGNKLTPFELITRKPILPSETENKENNRARSAKLRIAEKK